MRKILVIVFFLLLVTPSYLYAFKYAGIGFGPNIGLKGFDGTNYLLDAVWHPHDNVGGRLLVGFVNGFWVGAAIDLAHTDESIFRGVNWTMNFSIPFLVKIRGNVSDAYIGFTFGNTLLFDLTGEKDYYLSVTPAEFVFIPFTWKMSRGGIDTGMLVSLFCSVGFRVGL